MIDIQNKSYEPTIKEMTNHIQGKAKNRWIDLLEFLNDNFQPRSQINYSSCAAMPGWNVKYKSKNKALCTLYPRDTYFGILLVLNQTNMEWFEGIKETCTNVVKDRYEHSDMMNGTKWLMLDITEDDILDDVKKIIKLKLERQ